MVLSQEQIEKLKEQIYKQIESWPDEKKQPIIDEIESMDAEQFEEFIKQQNSEKQGNCIFCSINEGKIKSYKIDEDKENNAILEINPLSKGHSLIVSKNHDEKSPESSFIMAKKIEATLNTKFEPKEIKIFATKIMGHPVVEITPIYGDEKERKKASDKELEEIQKEFLKKDEKIEEKNSVKQSKDNQDEKAANIKEKEEPKEEKKVEQKPYKMKPRIP